MPPRKPSSIKSADAAACSAARQLGAVIRNLYVEQKGARLRRPYKLSTKDQNADIWLKAGIVARDCQVNPEVFIQALFEYSDNAQGPFPSQLTGEHARRCVEEYKKLYSPPTGDVKEVTFSVDERVKYEIQDAAQFLRRTCGTEDPSNERVRFQLRAHHTGIRAYIRCFLMPHDDEVMREFGDEARQYLNEHPQDRNALCLLNPSAVQLIFSYNGNR